MYKLSAADGIDFQGLHYSSHKEYRSINYMFITNVVICDNGIHVIFVFEMYLYVRIYLLHFIFCRP